MARTALRSRSADFATVIQLADRTGIVAASTPPAEPPDQPSTLVACTEAQRPVTRRVRRNSVFAAAAAAFLVVGWIGGGVWGQHDDPAPIVAVGPAPAEGGGGASNAPAPAAEPAPVPPAMPPAPSTAAPSTTVKPNPKPAAAKTSQPARADTGDSAPASTAPNPVDVLRGQLAQLPGPLPWSLPMIRGVHPSR